MKKITFLMALGAIAVSGLSAQLDPAMPMNAITLGQGGSYTAAGGGYNAFYYNPAGFSRGDELTLLSLNVYGVVNKEYWDLIAQSIASMDSKSLASASRADFDMSGFQTLIGNLTSYFEAAGESNLLSAAETLVDTYPELASVAAQYDSDGDTSNGITFDASLTQDEILAAILQADIDIPEILDAYIVLVETDSGVDATTYGVDDAGTQLEDEVNNSFAPMNARVGANLGIAYAGKGLGVGIFANLDGRIYTPDGSSLLEAQGAVLSSIYVPFGMSFPVIDGLDVGFLVRPTLLGYAGVDAGTMMAAFLTGSGSPDDLMAQLLSSSVYKGFYLGLDAGALWDIGPFTLGAALKDINPLPASFTLVDLSGGDITRLFFGEGSGSYTAEEVGYTIAPFKLNVGAQFHPDLGDLEGLMDLQVGADIMDLFGFIRNYEEGNMAIEASYNFLTHFNLGAQLSLLDVFDFRAGIYQAALTAGVGVRLPGFQLNTAVIFDDLNWEDMASYGAAPEFQNIGLSVEVAVRFPNGKNDRKAVEATSSEE